MVQGVCSGPVKIVIKEIANPDAVSQNVAESICEQLEKRMAFRRVMKKTIESTLSAGVKGVKMQISGSLNGAEMARTEKSPLVVCLCKPCAPTSTTVSPKLTPLTAVLA